MTGWIVFKQAPEAHYRADREDDSQKEFDWPPRFVKFMLKTDDDGENDIAFVDPRRLGRVRLIDEPKGDIRKLSPLKENGPDPVVDGLEEEWFKQKVLKRKVPIKVRSLYSSFRESMQHVEYSFRHFCLIKPLSVGSATGSGTKYYTMPEYIQSNTPTPFQQNKLSSYINQPCISVKLPVISWGSLQSFRKNG